MLKGLCHNVLTAKVPWPEVPQPEVEELPKYDTSDGGQGTAKVPQSELKKLLKYFSWS